MTVRRRRIRVALAIAGAVIAVVAMLVAGAWTALPSWLQGKVEQAASNALGRALTIGGPLEIEFGRAPRITATDVALQNAAWGSERSMVHAKRVTVVLDLASLGSGPLRVREVEIEGARLSLEGDGTGGGNWSFASTASPRRSSPPPPVVFDRAAIRGLELVVRPRPEATPIEVEIQELQAKPDPGGHKLALDGRGRYAESPWELAGWLSSLEDLVASREIDGEFAGRLGETKFGIRGLGKPDLVLSLDGPDVGAALARFGLRSPWSGPFRFHGRFAPVQDGVGVDIDLEGAVAGVTAAAKGRVGGLASLEQLDLHVEASGPDAAAVGSWIHLAGLPSQPFDLGGRVRRENGRLFVDNTTIHVGAIALDVGGALGAPPRWVGTDLTVRAQGRDLAELSPLTRLHLPAGEFEVAGHFFRRAEGLAVEGAYLRVGGARIQVQGVIGEPPRLPNLDLTFDSAGPDLAFFSGVASTALPAGAFEWRGRIARDGPAITLDGVEGRLGDDSGSVSGRLVPTSRLTGSDLELHVAGSDCGELAARLGLDGVPNEGYDLRGRVRFEPDGYVLDDVTATVGRLAASVAGRIGAPSARDGTSLTGRVHGPALADLSAWGLPEELPAQPFAIAGRIEIVDGVFSADRLEANVGEDQLALDGVLGALPDLSRLDAAIELSGPSLAGLGRYFAAAHLESPTHLPAESFAISGRVQRQPLGFDLKEVTVRVGEAEARLDGTIGSGEKLPGTELRVTASGTDLAAALGPVTGLSNLPAEAFEIALEIAGSTERFTSSRFSARLGESDLEGDFTLGIESRPFLEADLRAQRLDVAGLIAAFSALGANAPVTPVTPAPQVADEPPAEDARIFSDQPLPFGALQGLDATLRVAATEMLLPGLALRDVVVAGELRDGGLRIDRFEGTGSQGGRASGSLTIDSLREGYRVRTRGQLDGGRFVFPATATAPERSLPFEIDFDLAGEGRSPHEIVTAGDGQLLLVVGAGRIPSAVSERVTSGVLRGLLEAINPFRKADDSTAVECVVAAAEVTDGKAAIEPLVGRSDKMTVVGHGQIDLDSEAIDFYWTLKPRRGAGIPAASLASPFIRLGGTLAAPKLDLSPLKAVASTGAAVVTAGLTLVSGELFSRITGGRKVCAQALAKAQRQMAASQEAASP